MAWVSVGKKKEGVGVMKRARCSSMDVIRKRKTKWQKVQAAGAL
jgi:hypothetical protein